MKTIKPGVLAVGTPDWDRRLFDDLIPLPDGTTYNSYIVKGSEKTALIDTTDPSKTEELLSNLKQAGINKIDYIISHHAEQDHSGSIPKLLELFPGSKTVTNRKCADMLKDLMPIAEESFIIVGDGQKLELGGKTLEFIIAPWVHWPETMFSYLKEDKLLFSCDFLGSHLASSELYAGTGELVYESAKRYYAEIMMPFRSSIKTNLEKISKLEIETVAPSHGPVYDKPGFIIDAYREWISDSVKNEVVIPFVSMHGSTRILVDSLVEELTKRNISVIPFNLTGGDIGKLAISLVDAATIVLAAPTVLAGAHPSALYAAALANALRPKCRFASIIGSYGWGGRMVEQLTALLPNLKAEIIPPVLVKGLPKESGLKLIEGLAAAIADKHKAAGLLK
ncbi:MAG: MBL fold hydrolase [Elusimicrobia bacterium RIFOXYA1_FULL_47_7]|nr:MAG: MBL fold hydrolase [Elusimicrobia bacterium RIFOXYA1_FULL_47_7]OGS10859.1 MAG: MBL fold hydrolase [Elusimicrobia bacterium RIFOXYB1_FULL_48_9]OGS15770.1 MAG: MBL fold hydrolase [Elusimicrobia bacterium RIFOXYA2_FULL_47_53]OGS27094.1 MAG: MBL fold hydrolase [Elusimicrobia bacterium RIFOXYB12_FULL_50_12]OGS31063.1 MAG: MBL fold hydrolase [Elusimicrobia bacterium RIFOXYB2_FULL_46_23]